MRLINGDCLEEMDKLIAEGVKVDAIITDIPYGTTACKWDSVIPFDEMWERLNKIIKDNGAIVLFGTEPFSSALRMSNIKNYKYDWIWEKNNAGNFQLVKYQPLKVHEIISVFINISPNMEFANIMKYYMKKLNITQKDISKLELSKNNKITGWVSNKLNGSQLPTRKQWSKICKLFNIDNDYDNILKSINYPTYNLELNNVFKEMSNKNKAGNLGNISSETKRDSYLQTKTGYPKSILKYNRENTTSHPTQKPVALMEYLIKTYTKENEVILDFTMGSGSTGVACKHLNRDFIGIELDKNYYDIAVKRIKGE